jgi:hypothetical protein
MYDEEIMKEYLRLMMGYIDTDNTYEAIEAIKKEAYTKGHKEEVLAAESKFLVKNTDLINRKN